MTRGPKGGAPKRLEGDTSTISVVLDEPARRCLDALRRDRPGHSDSQLIRDALIASVGDEQAALIADLRLKVRAQEAEIRNLSEGLEQARKAAAQLDKLRGEAAKRLGEPDADAKGTTATALARDLPVIVRRWPDWGEGVRERAGAEAQPEPRPAPRHTLPPLVHEAANRAGGWGRLLELCDGLRAQGAPA